MPKIDDIENILDIIEKLQKDKIGNEGRLSSIKDQLMRGKELYQNDRKYLHELSNPKESSEKSLSEPTRHSNDKQEIKEIQFVKDESKFNSWVSAFGRGIGGIFLSFLGIGVMFGLNYYLTNLNEFTQSMRYSSVDPFMQIIYIIVVIPIILLIIAGVSFYYGIRIITKNR